MMGVEGGSSALHAVILAGLAGLVGGALSMVSLQQCVLGVYDSASLLD